MQNLQELVFGQVQLGLFPISAPVANLARKMEHQD
jgi:hypothetical protein